MPKPSASEFTRYLKYKADTASYTNGQSFRPRSRVYAPIPLVGTHSAVVRDSEVALTAGPSVGPTPPAPQTSGSAFFQVVPSGMDATASWFVVNSTGIETIGTGDFTVECFMKATLDGDEPRVFLFGSFIVYFENIAPNSSQLYVTVNGTPTAFGAPFDTKADWFHLAIVRRSNIITVFKNGSIFGSQLPDSTNFSGFTGGVVIGQNSIPPSPLLPLASTGFDGYITNFRIVIDPVYNAPFSPITTPLTVIPNTKLLLLETDSGSLTTDAAEGRTVTNTGVVWNAATPF